MIFFQYSYEALPKSELALWRTHEKTTPNNQGEVERDYHCLVHGVCSIRTDPNTIGCEFHAVGSPFH